MSFFNTIILFKNSIITDLRKFKIFTKKDIKDLEISLENIEKYRTKGGSDYRVYISTWIQFGKIYSKIAVLINFLSGYKIPFKMRIIDFIKAPAVLVQRELDFRRKDRKAVSTLWLIRKEIENITHHIGFSFEKFGVPALGTCKRRKPAPLNIENLTPKPARGPDFAKVILSVGTFGAFVI